MDEAAASRAGVDWDDLRSSYDSAAAFEGLAKLMNMIDKTILDEFGPIVKRVCEPLASSMSVVERIASRCDGSTSTPYPTSLGKHGERPGVPCSDFCVQNLEKFTKASRVQQTISEIKEALIAAKGTKVSRV